MKTKKCIFLILGLIALLGFGFAYQALFLNKPPRLALSPTEQNNTIENISALVNVFDGISTTSASMHLPLNSTAFNFLEVLAQKQQWQIETKDYGEMGLFIESINNIKNGADNRYWMYYVNNVQPQVSVSKQIINNNDIITFSFEAANW